MAKNAASTYDLPDYSRLTWAWIGAIGTLGLFIAGLIFFPPLFEAPEGKAPSSVLFFGRFHPIALHLPVGAMALLTLAEVMCLKRSFENRWGEAALFLALFFAGSSVVAIILGSMLGRDGFEGGAYKLHTFFGIIIGVLAIAGLLARLLGMQKRAAGRPGGFMLETARFLLLLNVGVMSVGAHFGANMVHGDKYLTQHGPESAGKIIHGFEAWLLSFVAEKKEAKPTTHVTAEAPVKPASADIKPTAAALPAVATGDSKLVFQHIISPLFEAKCNSCHCEQKVKGKLRMDDYALLMKGGSDGPNTIIPGKPEESLAIVRLMLPEDDDEHMPPSEKPQFTKEETALLHWWIKTGASATQPVTEVPAEHKATADTLMKGQS
jgi:hypothetical protein